MIASTEPASDLRRALAALVATGESVAAGVAALGLSPDAAIAILKEPGFADLVRAARGSDEAARAEIRSRFVAQASRASSVVAELMDEVDRPEVRLAAAKDILDRAGLTPVKRIESVRFVFDPVKQRQIRETILEAESRNDEEQLAILDDEVLDDYDPDAA